MLHLTYHVLRVCKHAVGTHNGDEERREGEEGGEGRGKDGRGEER